MRRMRRNHDQTKKTTWKPVTIRGRLIRIAGRRVSAVPARYALFGLFPALSGQFEQAARPHLDPQPHRCEAFSWL